MEVVIRPVIGAQELDQLVDYLGKLHDASRLAWQAKDGIARPANMLPILDWNTYRAPKSRLAEVEDRATGMDFAAHCIGMALAACGGLELMQMVDRMVCERFGVRASAWLDHRFNGVEIPGGGMWCS